MSNFALEICNISKNYKEFQMKDVSFKLEKGTIMGLVGQNGAGKTTVINLIMNKISRDGGEIKVYELDNCDLTSIVRKMQNDGKFHN